MANRGISIPEAPEYDPGGIARPYGPATPSTSAGPREFYIATGQFAGPTIREQTRQSLLNCQAILRAAGAELTDVVMVNVLLQRSEDAPTINEVFTEFYLRRSNRLGTWPESGVQPARSIDLDCDDRRHRLTPQAKGHRAYIQSGGAADQYPLCR